MSDRKSESYVMTVNPSNKSDMAKLEAVRTAISVSNKTTGTKLSVKCHGRLGPNNPNADKYAAKRTSTIKLEDAARWDVYVFGKASKTPAVDMKAMAASKTAKTAKTRKTKTKV